MAQCRRPGPLCWLRDGRAPCCAVTRPGQGLRRSAGPVHTPQVVETELGRCGSRQPGFPSDPAKFNSYPFRGRLILRIKTPNRFPVNLLLQQVTVALAPEVTFRPLICFAPSPVAALGLQEHSWRLTFAGAGSAAVDLLLSHSSPCLCAEFMPRCPQFPAVLPFGADPHQ